MSHYQVSARRYRPQRFQEVLGQDPIITTLKNAIQMGRLANAYLFCGSRGTGKTTLARLFAKALNCLAPATDHEPCNQCISCREIAAGHSLDVLEIDGASHRGIDDIRQINETVGYAAASGKYKIYIIDEVHMLTKEAFNALLKTLEEPPLNAKFFFATTEPHKVLPTILSRCQRFNLNRIPLEKIVEKLRHITQDMGVEAQEEALHIIAKRAEGGLRDAESLLDQVVVFHEGSMTVQSVSAVLGIMPKEVLFDFDKAGKEGRLAAAFEIAHHIFTEGKDWQQFCETLVEHFRNLLLIKLSGKQAPFLALSDHERDRYELSAQLYSKEQCLNLLDYFVELQSQIRFAPSPRIALEAGLLHAMRSHQRLPIEVLVHRLGELEQAIAKTSPGSEPSIQPSAIAQPATTPFVASPSQKPIQAVQKPNPVVSISEDPSPSLQDLDLGIKTASVAQKSEDFTPKTEHIHEKLPASIELGSRPTPEAQLISKQQQSAYDTRLQFAAVELGGNLRKKPFNKF
ncbi:DNA polymerase III subunit gamma/tau [Parachlamydia sp. AcF125]|uniref:DNA polymerase III subunit gamma/tau n=1 Tax=Parachlamydia sp. AcF125 TaxID=2795736 RepID=UPI001BCA34CC|nr:DNA polymerase III subunit gamma/tau [Parachlamydia sp. AcF125]MBS4167524.1 DNA polymerase III subunit tau [Parachlamydia sp. AcF125]